MSLHTLFLSLAWGLAMPSVQDPGAFPDVGYDPPAGWTGHRFILSQNYLQALPTAELIPWSAIDFKTNPREYLEAVLSNCFDGNIAVDFDVQNNTVRKWYHAPWHHFGPMRICRFHYVVPDVEYFHRLSEYGDA
jgi:hypothetical protein